MMFFYSYSIHAIFQMCGFAIMFEMFSKCLLYKMINADWTPLPNLHPYYGEVGQ